MPFRATVVDPEGLAFMSMAFEDAWLTINAKSPVPLHLQPGARDFLGHVVFGLWQRGVRDGLAALAIIEYGKSPKWG